MSMFTIEQTDARWQWVEVCSARSEKDAVEIAREREADHRQVHGRHLTHIETERQVGRCRVLGPDRRVVMPYRNIEALSKYLKRSSEEREAVPLARDLRALADKLDKMAETLGEERWGLLKSSVDWAPPATPTSESNAGRYDATQALLREIANKAREEAGFLPDRRVKDHYDWVTDVFLNLWLDAGRDRPKLYENSEAVVALEKVFENAGKPLSRERIIDLLRRAMKNPRVPRGVVDFTSIALAYAEATGIDGDAMLSSIFEQAGRLTEEVIESDPVVAAMRDFVAGRRTWAKLLAVLTDPNRKPPEGWPKSLESLIQRLRKSLESDVG